jgi:hypothetical protein
VDNTSLAPDGRSRFVDPDFCRDVYEITGIEERVLSSVFAGARKDFALDAVKTVVAENLKETPEAWTQELLGRAKSEGWGEHRPGYWDGYELTYEYNEFLRSIGRL